MDENTVRTDEHMSTLKPRYVFHVDPGHGWLEVTRAELVRLGIADKISHFSYQRGDKVFLEEDCDVGLFVQTKRALGEAVGWRTVHEDPTPIRNYQGYAP